MSSNFPIFYIQSVFHYSYSGETKFLTSIAFPIRSSPPSSKNIFFLATNTFSCSSSIRQVPVGRRKSTKDRKKERKPFIELSFLQVPFLLSRRSSNSSEGPPPLRPPESEFLLFCALIFGNSGVRKEAGPQPQPPKVAANRGRCTADGGTAGEGGGHLGNEEVQPATVEPTSREEEEVISARNRCAPPFS